MKSKNENAFANGFDRSQIEPIGPKNEGLKAAQKQKSSRFERKVAR